MFDHLAHHEVGALFANHRSQRDLDQGVLGVSARAVAGASVAATFGSELNVEPKRQQGVLIHLAPENHVPAGSTVAAIGAAHGHEGLSPETRATASAGPAFYENLDAVDEHYETRTGCLRALRRGVCGASESALRLDRDDADELPATAVVLEENVTAHLREDAVILGEARVLAGLEAGALLANDDAAARNQLAAEGLDAEAL